MGIFFFRIWLFVSFPIQISRSITFLAVRCIIFLIHTIHINVNENLKLESRYQKIITFHLHLTYLLYSNIAVSCGQIIPFDSNEGDHPLIQMQLSTYLVAGLEFSTTTKWKMDESVWLEPFMKPKSLKLFRFISVPLRKIYIVQGKRCRTVGQTDTDHTLQGTREQTLLSFTF